jgi:serine/threonine protein kinase
VASSRSTFGPYVIHEELGVGGMATVHRAELPAADGTSKQVALKRMLPALADSDEGLSSFLREAKLASYLLHANVAHTYELGQINGTYFIAMELITGHTLHAIMNRCATVASPMPVAVACSLLIQILDALDYAHNLTDHEGQPLGIIHRDVSPSNVIVASDSGVAKLIDFGIAKASAAGMQTMNVTLKGKWAYMAPEYVEQGQIDARADVFAVGVMAHELLVCRPLFSAADDIATLTNLRMMEIPLPSRANPSIPQELDQVVMDALARNPDERWQTAAAMRNALAIVAKHMSLEASPGEIARWLGDLFGSFSQFDDGAPTMAGAMAYEDPDDAPGRPSMPAQAFNPAVLDLAVPDRAATSPMAPPQEELLELAPIPAPKGTPAQPMSRPPGRMPTPAAASPVVRVPTPAAASPVVPSRTATPPAASPVVGRNRNPSGGNPVVPRTATPAAGSPIVARTRSPSGKSPQVASRTATPPAATPVAAPLDLSAPMPGDGNVPLDFDPPLPPPRNEFSPPEVSGDSRSLSQMMTSDTTTGLAYRDPDAAPPVASALPTPPPNTMRTKAPRLETGAEPLWDIGGLKIEPLKRRPESPTTAPVVVTVHKDKQRVAMTESAKRLLIIAAAVLVTLGLAAAGYFLFA